MRGPAMSRSWHDHARRLRARRAARKWHQSDVARPLDGHAQPALRARAHARHPARQDFPALLHELRQDVRAFVVDEVHLLDTELAHLLLAEILALAPGPASGTARTAAPWSAFAPRATVPAARTAMTATVAAFTPRSSAGRWCLFLFLCHTFHPFTYRPERIGINLLVILDAFAVLGHAIRKFPRAPVLGLLDLAALFRASVLDDREDFLDLLFRRRRPHDENQIVITLFHDDLFFD